MVISMKKKLKFVIGGLVALGVMVAVVIILSKPPLEVAVQIMTPEDVAYTFKEEGIATANVGVTLASAVNGSVLDGLVKEGQWVKKGDVVAEVDSSMLLLQTKEASAMAEGYQKQVAIQDTAIQEAEDQRNLAAKMLEQQKELFQAGAVSQAGMDEAERNFRSAEAALASARDNKAYQQSMAQSASARVEQLQLEVSRCKIVAPFDGIVEEVLVRAGDMVVQQSPMVRMYNPDSLVIQSYVRIEDGAKLAVGDQATVIIPGNAQDTRVIGTIVTVSPYAVERISTLGVSERRLKIEVKADGESGLGSGFRVDVEYVADREAGCLAVPKKAIFPYDSGYAVWVIKEGTARIVPVKQGLKTNTAIVVTDGLQTGDAVILNAPGTLREGNKVRGKAVN